jgi:hypothetical protein
MKMNSPLLELNRDTRRYFEKALKIKNKNAEIIPFETNWSQDQLIDIIEKHYTKYPDPKTRPTLYIIILKARQQGMSTAAEGAFFKGITIGMPNDKPHHKTAMIISYDEDSAKTINEMSNRFYQHLPEVLKPMKRNSRGKGIMFSNPTNVQAEFEKKPGLESSFIIDTANNLNAGSGKTINFLHISELSKWQNPKETMTSLMQSVPKTNSIVIVESTANGAGDYFHSLWQKAEAGENDYVPLFLPWFSHAEYSDSFASEKDKQKLIDTLDEEEKQLIALHDVTLEQLNWRRNTIRNKCEGDVDIFHQEYPSTAEEAFLTSGRPKFDMPTLRNYLKQCVDGQRGYLERKGGKVTFVPDSKGYIEIWEYPQSSKQYGIGGDVAKGLITGDYSAGPVYDENEDMVALWHGHIDPDLFADQLELLGLYYNEAVIAPEENNQGLAVINRLKENYWNIYKRTTYDKTTDTEKEQLGWWTSEKTKALAINNLARLIRTKQLGTKSKKFIQECMTYIIEDNGSTNAQKGSHDDIVMASAIILYIMPSYVTPVQSIVTPSTPVQESNDFNWVGKKHISEIEDEQKDDEDDGWLNRWGG